MLNKVTTIIFDWGRTLYDVESEDYFDDTQETLEILKGRGYALAIVSLATAGVSKIKERQRIIKETGFDRYFSSIMFDTANKEILYDQTLETLHVKPQKVLVVDDRMIRGILWANNSNAQSAWVNRGKFSHETPESTGYTPTLNVAAISDILEHL